MIFFQMSYEELYIIIKLNVDQMFSGKTCLIRQEYVMIKYKKAKWKKDRKF